MTRIYPRIYPWIAVSIWTSAVASASAQDETDPYLILNEWVSAIDADAVRPSINVWQFVLEDRPMIVVADAAADRMRIMSPIVDADKLDPELYERMLVANFDAALDARYAIGDGVLWGTFIHPLSDLTAELFFSATGQVYNVAETFGTTYSSGLLLYGGGDSDSLNTELFKRLEKLAEDDRI